MAPRAHRAGQGRSTFHHEVALLESGGISPFGGRVDSWPPYTIPWLVRRAVGATLLQPPFLLRAGAVLSFVGVVVPLLLLTFSHVTPPPTPTIQTPCGDGGLCLAPLYYDAPSWMIDLEVVLELTGFVGVAISVVPAVLPRLQRGGIIGGLPSIISAVGLAVLAVAEPAYVSFFPLLWPALAPYLVVRAYGGALSVLGGTVPPLPRTPSTSAIGGLSDRPKGRGADSARPVSRS